MAETGADGDTKKVIDKVSSSLNGLAGTVVGVATTFALTKPTMSSAVKSLGLLGKPAAALVGVLEGQVKQYQDLTKSGANFGGNLAQLTLSSTAAGLSVAEMTKLVTSNSESLAGFGSTVDDGVSKFLDNLKIMRSDGNQYGMQLRNIGLTHEEIGEAMMHTQRMDMMSGRKRAAGDMTIQAATATYAKDLDLLAKLTGKNADELKKNQAAMARSGDFKAMQLGMSTDMSNAILMAGSQADASGYGDLFKDMMIRGFPSADQRALAGTMGSTMRVMEEMHIATKNGDHVRLAALKKDLLVAGLEDKARLKQIAMLGSTTKVSGVVSEMIGKTSDFEMKQLAKIEAKKKQGLAFSMASITAEVEADMAKAKAEQDAQGGTATKTSKVGDDRSALDGMLRGQEAVIAMAVKTQATLTTTLYNDTIGPMLQTISTDSGIMGTASKKAAEGLDKLATTLTTLTNTGADPTSDAATLELIAKLTIFANKATTSITDAAAATEIRTNLKGDQTLDQRTTSFGNAHTLLGTTPQSDPGNPRQRVPEPGDHYARGTPGIDNAVSGLTSFASITKDFGKESLALLHGNELVMTKAQAKQLDLGILALSNNMSGALAQMDAALSANNTSLKAPPSRDEARALGITKGKSQDELRKLAQMGSSGVSNTVAGMLSNSTRPEGAMRQGAINTVRSRDNSPMGNDNSGLEEMFKQMITGELIPSLATMTAGLPSEAVLGSLLDTSKQQLGNTMQQLAKLESGNKLTKRLRKAGNAFGGVGV